MFVTLLRIAIDRQRDRDMNRANRHREVVRDRQIDRYIYIERETCSFSKFTSVMSYLRKW